ncbi:hypothetical protein CBR_g28703 [Chara braunii]|uniref:Uncharacterized protein n=1 Tax=Chara braunii TaxID=69332 RepID=A0A388L9K2_CHABU|nr:hypothetical protein CBR_g28703 [Chara braunii]|eukprot:GBG78990.1 hypothetical protein CBR_g28703 [Chara braunii]
MVAGHTVESAAGGRRGREEVPFAAADVCGQRMMTSQGWRGDGRGEGEGREEGGRELLQIRPAVLLHVVIALLLMAAAQGVSAAEAERLQSVANGRDRDRETVIPTATWGRKGVVVDGDELWKKSGRGMNQDLWWRSLSGGRGGGGEGGEAAAAAAVKTRGVDREVHVEENENDVFLRGLRVIRSDDGGERRRRRRRRKLRISEVGIRALQVTPDPAQQAAQQARTAPIGQQIVTPDGHGGTVVAVRLNAGDFAKTGYTFNEYQIPSGTTISGSPGEVVLVYHKSVSAGGSTTSVTVTAYAASNTQAGQPGTQVQVAAPSTSPIIVRVQTSDPSQVLTCPGGGQPLPGGGGCQVENLDGQSSVPSSVASPSTASPSKQLPSVASSPSSGINAPGISQQSTSDEGKPWRVIVGATVGSVFGAIVLVGAILAATRLQRESKIGKMNQATEKGETLQTALVGASRAPAAPNVRTKAHLETEDF